MHEEGAHWRYSFTEKLCLYRTYFVVCGSLVKYKLIIVCKKFGIVCKKKKVLLSQTAALKCHTRSHTEHDVYRQKGLQLALFPMLELSFTPCFTHVCSALSGNDVSREIGGTSLRKNMSVKVCNLRMQLLSFPCPHSLDIVTNSQVSMHFHGIMNSKKFLLELRCIQ